MYNIVASEGVAAIASDRTQQAFILLQEPAIAAVAEPRLFVEDAPFSTLQLGLTHFVQHTVGGIHNIVTVVEYGGNTDGLADDAGIAFAVLGSEVHKLLFTPFSGGGREGCAIKPRAILGVSADEKHFETRGLDARLEGHIGQRRCGQHSSDLAGAVHEADAEGAPAGLGDDVSGVLRQEVDPDGLAKLRFVRMSTIAILARGGWRAPCYSPDCAVADHSNAVVHPIGYDEGFLVQG
mmetsp:Transcript_160457/g.515046  ORF Transcript_160457/g.515046 Transcript_160457/m.515046 type:complete len:237 (+) Transcript_160457:614-1324(+)